MFNGNTLYLTIKHHNGCFSFDRLTVLFLFTESDENGAGQILSFIIEWDQYSEFTTYLRLFFPRYNHGISTLSNFKMLYDRSWSKYSIWDLIIVFSNLNSINIKYLDDKRKSKSKLTTNVYEVWDIHSKQSLKTGNWQLGYIWQGACCVSLKETF